ncbi:helix-turn-helix domain-containing protein [Macrococcoides goetzii]|uniref:helix-turn-helix domain-containing protein n=1 Tax=Macrococcus sp. PK TaxID=2801919 RepID=UPI001F0DB1F9|nr:helix-turn-helix transcriptional regulator [Macrococcus sp. PK]MCH4985342.1 helix-turn-helix transcriptional regulator [Macrococcus sp. PK]
MIRNKLSDLMGERRLKISRLSLETGIARSTLTPIYYNQSEMIKLDTINKLCIYFGISACDFFENNNFDFEYSIVEDELIGYEQMWIREDNLDLQFYLNFSIYIKIIEKNKNEVIEVNCHTTPNTTISDQVVYIDYLNNGNGGHEETISNIHYEITSKDDYKDVFAYYIEQLSPGMLEVVKSNIEKFIKEALINKFTDTNIRNDYFGNDFHMSLEDVFKKANYTITINK